MDKQLRNTFVEKVCDATSRPGCNSLHKPVVLVYYLNLLNEIFVSFVVIQLAR